MRYIKMLCLLMLLSSLSANVLAKADDAAPLPRTGPANDAYAGLDDAIAELMAHWGIPGGTLAVGSEEWFYFYQVSASQVYFCKGNDFYW